MDHPQNEKAVRVEDRTSDPGSYEKSHGGHHASLSKSSPRRTLRPRSMGRRDSVFDIHIAKYGTTLNWYGRFWLEVIQLMNHWARMICRWVCNIESVELASSGVRGWSGRPGPRVLLGPLMGARGILYRLGPRDGSILPDRANLEVPEVIIHLKWVNPANQKCRKPVTPASTPLVSIPRCSELQVAWCGYGLPLRCIFVG